MEKEIGRENEEGRREGERSGGRERKLGEGKFRRGRETEEGTRKRRRKLPIGIVGHR